MNQMNIAIVVVLLAMFFFILAMLLVLWLFSPWLKAFLSGTPISVVNLLGMRLRRTDPNKILPHGIASSQAGFPISWASLESAYIQGIDLEKVTTAYIATHKRGDEFTFEELVDAARDSRLKKMLKN